MSTTSAFGNAGPRVLSLGTRASALALAQSGTVARDLEETCSQRGLDVRVDLQHITTQGDTDRASLRSMGGTGVFAARLREALLADECDLAVHSYKDLPSAPHPGLTVIAIPRREDPRDVLCARDGLTLDQLPEGARIGTGSPRRAAQLLLMRPDLDVVDLRGNVPTRLKRVGDDLDGVILAAAGLRRLGLEDAITQEFDAGQMVPAAGQGALAIEIADHRTDLPLDALRDLDDPDTRTAVEAERSLMAALQAGCSAPVGAHASVDEDFLMLTANVTDADTGTEVRVNRGGSIHAPSMLGEGVAAALIERGAKL